MQDVSERRFLRKEFIGHATFSYTIVAFPYCRLTSCAGQLARLLAFWVNTLEYLV